MRYLRPRFQDMIPYHSNHVTEGVILNANESAYAPPKGLGEHMRNWVEAALVARYPDTDSRKLCEAIAEAFGVKSTNVTCGVGSDELLDCILSSVLEDGDQVISPQPSFSMYAEFTKLNSGQFIPVALKEDFTYDVAALREAVTKYQPKVTFLCNPNNPTGCLLTQAEIKSILEVAEGLVVVDEAYAEFEGCTQSMISEINEYNNLIVLKTFSKAYALAGARVGYAIACEDLIDLIDVVKVPYNLSIFSQEAAIWAISHSAAYELQIKAIMTERSRLTQALEQMGVKAYPSAANFIWTELPEDIFAYLNEKQIYIRKMAYAGKTYFRISVGTFEENTILLNAIKNYLGL